MTDLRTAAQQALKFLDAEFGWSPGEAPRIDALRAALAEPQEPDLWGAGYEAGYAAGMAERPAEPMQEPVAFMDAPERIYLQVCEDDHCEVPFHEHDEKTWCTTKQNPLDVPYVRADLAAPLQRKPLTGVEIEKAYREIWRDLPSDFDHTSSGWIEQGVRYAERAHGIT